MLLINRHGPAELHQMFERVSRVQMLSMIEDRYDYSSSILEPDNLLQKSGAELLGTAIHVVYLDLGYCVNKNLRESAIPDVNLGQVVVTYSPLNEGFTRGNKKHARNGFYIAVDDICTKVELEFCIEMLEPFPDIARSFDDKIF